MSTETTHSAEIMHAAADKAIVRGHDLEEFTQVIARYGLWLDDAKMMADTIRQLELGVPA